MRRNIGSLFNSGSALLTRGLFRDKRKNIVGNTLYLVGAGFSLGTYMPLAKKPPSGSLQEMTQIVLKTPKYTQVRADGFGLFTYTPWSRQAGLFLHYSSLESESGMFN